MMARLTADNDPDLITNASGTIADGLALRTGESTFALSLLSNLIEVFTILGFVVCAVCLIWLACLVLARGPWKRVRGLVADDTLYWFAHDGPVRERPLSSSEVARYTGDDQIDVYYRSRALYASTFEPKNHDEQLLGRLGLLFLGVAIVSAAASIALLFIP